MNQRTKKAKKNKQKNVGKSRQQSTKYWMAMGTMSALLACAPDYADAATPTREMIAPTFLDAIYRQDRAQARTTQRFDIPPGSLDSVLNAFQNLTKWRVLTPNEFIRSLPSPGVSGVSTVEQALKQILAGTGIVYRFTGEETVTLDLEKITGSVDVIDRVEGITSPKFTEPLRNTPQSVAVVSRQVMEDQGTMTLRDSLRNVAGISLAAGEGGAQGDNLTIRGFTARNDIFNDGMRDFGSYYRDPFNLEEVEVLKGPSSVSFGRGTTGGVVNQASKTPQSKGFISGSVNFGSDQTRRGSLDINEPLPKLGTGSAFRLNLMGNDSKVAGRDIAENRRYGIAPSLAFGLDSHTRLTLSYFHLSADDIPDYGIPWLFNGPANVPRNNYYGFKDANFLDTDADIGTVRLEHDFNESISLRNQWRYARYNREAQITEARLAGTVTPTTPLSAINVTRNQIAVDSVETFLQNQTDLTARFRTGFIRHTVVAGIEAGRETSDPTRFTFTGVPVTSLLRPDTHQIFSGTSTASSRVNTTATSVAAYLLDTLKLGEKWELIGGVRWDRFDADYSQSVAPASAFHRVDNMTSWRGAVVYKPLEQGSVYFDYGTSFNPSAESLSLSAGTANAAPEKNTTYELGSKWDLYTKKLSLRASLFRTEKTNARETDPTNALLVVLSGNQRVSGFEAEVTGLLTDRWQMLASYALLDSELVSSKFFPAAIGSRLANVPRNTFSLWTNYRSPLWKLSFGGGGQFVDSRSASSTAPLDPATGLVKEVPSYWVFNGVVKRPLTERIDVQLNAYNLTNRYYYDQLHPAHIVPGPGRSVLLGVNFKF